MAAAPPSPAERRWVGRLAALVRPPAPEPWRRPELDVLRSLRNRAEFDAACADRGPRLEFERALAAGHEGDECWSVPGYCLACDAPARFVADWRSSVQGVPNWRERLQCPACGLNNRQRFVAHLVRESGARDVYLYEQITPFWEWAERALPGAVGSEYLGPDVAPGAVVKGVRHEDALALTIADDSLDLIVSNDVFEHVPDIDAALAEAARVLRAGGRMLFSVPFHSDRELTTQRAKLEAGELIELAPPEHHGNPVDPERGSLVFFDYGWDLLDRCRAAGFADAHVIGYWSALYGHIGGGIQVVFTASM
jgi:SAM-dependent methyltransferase